MKKSKKLTISGFLKIIAILIIFLSLSPFNAYAKYWYVVATGANNTSSHPDGASTNTGVSWDSALDSIVSAIEKAEVKNGHTIFVASGTYNENDIKFLGKAIKIISESGPESTTLTDKDGGSVVWIHQGEYSASCLSGFTLGQGNDNGSLYIENASPTIENCIIDNNSGPGICVVGPDEGNNYATPYIKKCIIINNKTTGTILKPILGNGITVKAGGNPTLHNCVIADNAGYGISAVGNAGFLGLKGQPSSFNAINCTIAYNEKTPVYVKANVETHATLSNCIVMHKDDDSQCIKNAALIKKLFPNPIAKKCVFNGDSNDLDEISVNNKTIKLAQTSFINAGPINTNNNYHLAMNSPCIAAGEVGLPVDIDDNMRPYFLNGSWDVGAYEFDFAYLVENDLKKDTTTWDASTTQWKIITARSTVQKVDSNISPGATPQTFETHYYKINLNENYGTLRIWTEDSTSAKGDTVGYLINGDDWKNDAFFKVDDNSGNNGNFKIIYPYTDGINETYYLAVKGRNTNPYNLHIQVETDPEDNICSNAVSSAKATIDKHCFSVGYTDKTITGTLNFSDDIDNHKFEFSLPGTIKITSATSNIEAVLKDSNCNTVAEGKTTTNGIEILFDNIEKDILYLGVQHSNPDESSATDYNFTIKYYPPDDWYDVVTGVLPDPEWTATDLHTKGYLNYDSTTGEYIVAGNGAGLDDGDGNPETADLDEFYYAFKNITGDFNFTVRVKDLLTTESSSYQETAGLMVRDSLKQDSRNVFAGINPASCSGGTACTDGTGDDEHQRKFTTRGRLKDGIDAWQKPAVDYGYNSGFLTWLNLQREGNSYTTGCSNDGLNWTNTTNLTMDGIGNIIAGRLKTGMTVSSYNTIPDYMFIGDPVRYYKTRINHVAAPKNKPQINFINYTGYYSEPDPNDTDAPETRYSYKCVNNYHIADNTNRPRRYKIDSAFKPYLDGTYYPSIGAVTSVGYECMKTYETTNEALNHMPRRIYVNHPIIANRGNVSYECIKDNLSVDDSDLKPRLTTVALATDGAHYYVCLEANSDKIPPNSTYWLQKKWDNTSDGCDGDAIEAYDEFPVWDINSFYGSITQEYWKVITYNAAYPTWIENNIYGPGWQQDWKEVPYNAKYENLSGIEPGVNLALGKTATQSTNSDGTKGHADKAVDGDTNGDWGHGSVTHTEDPAADAEAWWQVDLGETNKISHVNLYNRSDCCSDLPRLQNFYLFISNSSMDKQSVAELKANISVWYKYYPGIVGVGNNVTIHVDTGISGRYVMIKHAETRILSLAEVEVISSSLETTLIEDLGKAWSFWQPVNFDTNFHTWASGEEYGNGWIPFWKSVNGNSMVGNLAIKNLPTTDEWTEGKTYETSQLTTASFDNVDLDTRDIILRDCDIVNTSTTTGPSFACIKKHTNAAAADTKPGEGDSWTNYWKELPDYHAGYPQWLSGSDYLQAGKISTSGKVIFRGAEKGHITIRPATIQTDFDIFEFEIAKTGNLTIQTTGCVENKKAKLDVYNSVGEIISTKEDFNVNNYKISEIYADSPTEAVPFQIFPGKYYIKVSPYKNYKEPFKYGLYIECESTDDEHGNYRANATLLQKWYKDAFPLTYFNPEGGKIDSGTDKDMFRFDVPEYSSYPNGAKVSIMSDYACSGPNPVAATLYDYSGNTLGTSTDIRMANPYYPQATIPPYSDAQAYSVNDVVIRGSNHYKCIKTMDTLRHTKMILEDGEGGTGKWDIYDIIPDGPVTPAIEVVQDSGNNVIKLISNGTENGFRLTQGKDIKWRIKDKTILEWSMKTTVAGAYFLVYIDVETTDTSIPETGGHRHLCYTPSATDGLGAGELVLHGLGTTANDGTWHTFTRNLADDLHDAQAANDIVEINGFWIRGNNYVDDISLTGGETISEYWEKVLVEDWVRGDAYLSGDIVKFDNEFFICQTGNNSKTDPGDISNSNWDSHPAKKWTPYTLYIAYVSSYSDANSAIENNNLYKCVQTMTMPLPVLAETSNDYWELIATPPANNNLGNIIERKLDSGKYYVEITGLNNTNFSIVVDLDDYGNSTTDAKPFTGFNNIKGHFETVRGGISPEGYDADVFELIVPQDNMKFTIYTTGSSATYGNLKFPDNSVHYRTYGTIDNPNFSFATDDLAAGTYYIQMCMSNTTETGDYNLHIDQTDDFINHWDDCTVTGSTWGCTGSTIMGILFAGSDKTGVIETPGDIDFFLYQPDANGRVTIQSTGNLDTIASFYKYHVTTGKASRLKWDSDGTGDREGNFKISHDVLTGFSYLLYVKSQFAQDTGPYNLSISLNTTESSYDKDDDGYGGSGGDSYNEARQIDITESGTGQYSGNYTDGGIDYQGDKDYYKFTVTGEGSLNVYTKDVEPVTWVSETAYGKDKIVTYNDNGSYYYQCIADSGSSAATLPHADWIEVAKPQIDTFGYLYQYSNGLYTRLAMNDDSEYDSNDGFNFGIIHYIGIPGESTEFYVQVKNFSKNQKGSYSFHVDFDSTKKDDHGDNCALATSVGPADDHAGNIGIPGDIDFFRFVLGPVGVSGGALLANSHDTEDSQNSSETMDLFGYLKNAMCTNILMDDNGLGSDEDFLLEWTQPCNPADSCEDSPSTCCRPEVFNVAVRSYDSDKTGTYQLNIDSNGSFVDWGENRSWAPADGAPHYFGFEIPPTRSTLQFTANNAAGDLGITLFSGVDGTEIPGYESYQLTEETFFRLNRAGLSPGTYYAKVSPSASSTTSFQVTVGNWRWNKEALGSGSGNLDSGDSDSQEFTITARGVDIWETADSGYFVFRHIPGDFEMSARIFWLDAPNAWSKAGIMARTEIAAGAVNIYSAYSGTKGYTAQFRDTVDTIYTTSVTGSALHSYVKLKRKGDVLTAYMSKDGDNWEFARSETISGNLIVGMAASSTDTTANCKAIFQNVEFTTEASGF